MCSRPFPKETFWWSCDLLFFRLLQLILHCMVYTKSCNSCISMIFRASFFISEYTLIEWHLAFFLHHVRFKPPILLMYKLSAPRQNAYDKHVTCSRTENFTYDILSAASVWCIFVVRSVYLMKFEIRNINGIKIKSWLFHHDGSL